MVKTYCGAGKYGKFKKYRKCKTQMKDIDHTEGEKHGVIAAASNDAFLRRRGRLADRGSVASSALRQLSSAAERCCGLTSLVL